MHLQKILSLSTVAASLVLVTGCTTQTITNDKVNSVVNTNTDTMVNTNVTNDNTNVVVANSNENTNTVEVNANTNVEQGSEIDTSDWLTYTNEEYGFNVKYPRNWIYFNKIDSDGYAIYDNVTTDFVRFTNSENAYSASSFVDITITVTELKPNSSTKKYITHNDRYYIFDEGTWPNEELLSVLERMMQSIRFDS